MFVYGALLAGRWAVLPASNSLFFCVCVCVKRYVNEIYAYMRQLEAKLYIRENYLEHITGHGEREKKSRQMR